MTSDQATAGNARSESPNSRARRTTSEAKTAIPPTALEDARAAFEVAIAAMRLDSDPFLRIKFPQEEEVLKRISQSSGIVATETLDF